ncbi:M48 family metallopeptidase [Thermomonas carbonis]|uniref:M48 family metalloprotease n=1 Tax=Thermomonas carbonis TaxID=1463158 RepID=A0A7G9SSF4_9GAMM|nr:M48 family metallopeptidase [Thermomonas carbonis]QNN70779.1 M48 family metalloprotease [Thermomonas carbonis]GHC02335.1 hypothetical protein GCM10010080_15180 [Thermomonas carbonis]
MATADARRQLIERLEREAERSPGRYKVKVALLAALGFVVLGGAVVLAFGLSIGLVVVLLAISPLLLLKLAKLIWIPIAFGWVLLRSLWIKFSPPDGYQLGKDEAPALREEVERLRAATGAPRLDGIVIDADLNAAAASVPRAMGLLGQRHYLVLGMPLMHLLDRAQFASVVAHEFGHFGGGHGRFSGRIYYVRMSWYRLLEALQAQRSWANAVFVRFFDWYAPYFNAYTFVLARAQEYQADATAARVVGPRAAAQALVRVNLGAERLEQDFWPGVQRASQAQAAPPALLYGDMRASLLTPAATDGERLARALAHPPGFDDTHPTLAQRLAALGVDAEGLPAQGESAAGLLGDLLPELERRFSEDWRDRVQAGWEQNFRQHAQDRERLAELDAMEVRDPGQVVERARLMEALLADVDAIALYRDALAYAPDDGFAHLRLGAMLLERGDAAGVGLLRKAIALDADSTEAALHCLDNFYRETGDAAGRDGVAEEWKRLQAAQIKVHHARNELTTRDEFLPHGLDDGALASVHAALERSGNVGGAWLARKRLPGADGGLPHYVMLVKWRGIVFSEDSKLQKIVDALELPGSCMVFVASNRRGIARKLRKAAGVPVYRKGWW